MTIEQVGIIATLILTVIGWGITAFIQWQILGRQISAEKEGQIRTIIFTERLKQLTELKTWFQDGEKLWRMSLTANNPQSMKSQIKEWKLRVGIARASAKLIDFAYPTDFITKIDYAFRRWLYRAIGQDITEDKALFLLVEEFYKISERMSPNKQDLSIAMETTTELNETFLKAMFKIDRIITERLSETDNNKLVVDD